MHPIPTFTFLHFTQCTIIQCEAKNRPIKFTITVLFKFSKFSVASLLDANLLENPNTPLNELLKFQAPPLFNYISRYVTGSAYLHITLNSTLD